MNNSLTGGTRHRLAKLKRYAEKWNNGGKHITVIDWKRARTFGVCSINHSGNGSASRSGDTLALPVRALSSLRDESKAKNGWYCDTHCDEVYTGQVWRLSHNRFISGYVERDSGYAVLNREVYDDADQALREASHIAERNAERSRDDEHAQEIEQRRDELRDEAKSIRKQWRTLQEVANKTRDNHAQLIRALVEIG